MTAGERGEKEELKLNEAQAKLQGWELAFLQKQAAQFPDCKYCQELLEKGEYFAPHHRGSGGCRSGGRAHCTCDTCF